MIRRPTTVRVRLTALYAGLFIVTATALLVTVDILLKRSFDRKIIRMTAKGPPGVLGSPPPTPPTGANGVHISSGDKAKSLNVAWSKDVADDLRDTVLRSQWIVTGIALLVLAVVAVVIAWWLAGRVLRPLHRITATARKLSLSNLGERIALTGPRDELRELADTFDAMLGRLEAAFDSQRRFVANASHELRTPLAVQRAAIEIGLENPSPERFAEVKGELLETNRRSERLIDGLLTLAQGERGLSHREPVEFDEVAEGVVDRHREAASDRGVSIEVETEPVTVSGDQVLLGRLVANLVHNAIRYNEPGGRITVRVTGDAALTVTNTGPDVPADRIDDIFEPFRRLNGSRTGSREGAGLGLSIVASIARAHGAEVTAHPNPGGGLRVTVAFARCEAYVATGR